MARIEEILASEGPQTIDRLIAEGGVLVPPGQAFRHREYLRRWNRYGAATGAEFGEAELTDEAIWTGRRRIIRKSLWTWKRHGKVVIYNADDGTEMVRLLRPFRDNYAQAANMTAEERSARARKGWEGLTPEQRSERNKGVWEKMSPEARSRRQRKIAMALPPAKRSAAIKLGWARMSPEDRAARVAKTLSNLKGKRRDSG